MVTHLHFERSGDKEIIAEYRTRFSHYSNEELIAEFNSIKGVYGVHRQGLYFIGMNLVFMERFGKSPFKGDGKMAFGIGIPIIYFPDLKTFLPAKQS